MVSAPVGIASNAGRLAEASDLLKRLSHPVRLAVVCHLATRDCSVGEMEATLGLAQPALSQQLAELRTAGILASRREGKGVIYSLSEPRAKALVATLHTLFCAEPPSVPPKTGPSAARLSTDPLAAAVFARVILPANEKTA